MLTWPFSSSVAKAENRNPTVASVVLQDVTKVFYGAKGERIVAVDGVSLTVPDKQLLSLVGPSGCGKTTLLRLIAGLEEPTTGTITLDGQVVNRLPPKDRGVAMVFQNPALYPHLSVYDNLAFGLKLRKCPSDEIQRRVLETAEILDLIAYLERKPQALSGGQRQRVSLGRALVRKAKVFLLDEPLSNLDWSLRVQMRAEIAKIQAQLGVTMIYVTHDQVEASMLGKQVAVMNRGAIQQVADPMTLYRCPVNLWVAGFVGSPPMNLICGSVARVGAELVFVERTTVSAPPLRRISIQFDGCLAARLQPFVGKELVLGLRPEDIHSQELARSEPKAPTAQAVVQLVQPLGWETLVYVATAAHLLAVRLPAGLKIELHQELSLQLDLSSAHFFDPANGSSIP
jgi:multiple sugar transport system ATP-binding protein